MTDVKANSVKLKWNKPEDDGGQEITYVVQFSPLYYYTACFEKLRLEMFIFNS